MMKSYKQYAIEKLKTSGLRITLARKLILEILDRAEKALSVNEIIDILSRQKSSIDKVSVYRIIECLEEHKLIHRTLFSGKVVKCSLYNQDNNINDLDYNSHYLLLCNKCGIITEIQGHNLVQFPSNDNFTTTGYNLEFTGYCNSCK